MLEAKDASDTTIRFYANVYVANFYAFRFTSIL